MHSWIPPGKPPILDPDRPPWVCLIFGVLMKRDLVYLISRKHVFFGKGGYKIAWNNASFFSPLFRGPEGGVLGGCLGGPYPEGGSKMAIFGVKKGCRIPAGFLGPPGKSEKVHFLQNFQKNPKNRPRTIVITEKSKFSIKNLQFFDPYIWGGPEKRGFLTIFGGPGRGGSKFINFWAKNRMVLGWFSGVCRVCRLSVQLCKWYTWTFFLLQQWSGGFRGAWFLRQRWIEKVYEYQDIKYWWLHDIRESLYFSLILILVVS